MITLNAFSRRSVCNVTIRLPQLGRGGAWAILIAATLIFKSFVPLLAAASAQMQGKDVADICSVYGVRLAPATGHGHHGSHPMEHVAGMEMPAMEGGGPASDDGPANHSTHSQEHCALTGLAACAVFALTSWATAVWAGDQETPSASGDGFALQRDPSARWLTLRLHAPPSMA